MKKRVLVLSLLFAVLLHYHCRKGSSSFGSYRGKLSYAKCGTVVIDVDGGNIGTAWTDPVGTQHSNAITVNNYCYISSAGLKIGDTITFKVSDHDQTNSGGCLTEYCLIAGPSASVFIYDAAKL